MDIYIYMYYMYLCLGSRVCPIDPVQRHSYIFTVVWIHILQIHLGISSHASTKTNMRIGIPHIYIYIYIVVAWNIQLPSVLLHI